MIYFNQICFDALSRRIDYQSSLDAGRCAMLNPDKEGGCKYVLQTRGITWSDASRLLKPGSPQVTGAGLKSTNALYNFQCSAHVFFRPLATSSISRNSSQPTSDR